MEYCFNIPAAVHSLAKAPITTDPCTMVKIAPSTTNLCSAHGIADHIQGQQGIFTDIWSTVEAAHNSWVLPQCSAPMGRVQRQHQSSKAHTDTFHTHKHVLQCCLIHTRHTSASAACGMDASPAIVIISASYTRANLRCTCQEPPS